MFQLQFVALFLVPLFSQTGTQSANAIVAPREPRPRPDILVLAPADKQGSIDRTSYIVKDNPEARASTALDLLGRVPSVDVAPSGQVLLIGRSGVSVQIDGQEVANAHVLLRAMQGSEVARIEVMTNPSAKVSARGTGGVVNIVTRRSSGAGLGGSATISAGRFGSFEERVSPSWTRGKLSLSGSIGVRREGSESESVEEWAAAGDGGDAVRSEDEDGRGRSDSVTATIKSSVEVAPRQTLSLDGMVVRAEGSSRAETEIIEDGARSLRRSRVASETGMQRIAGSWRLEGSRPGGMTSVSASRTSFDLDARRRFVTQESPGGSLFGLSTSLEGSDTVIKADHVRPAGERQLSIGGQWQQNIERSEQQTLTARPGWEPVPTDQAFDGRWSEAAAYATYEFPLLEGTVQAGARLESRWFEIDGVAGDPASRTHIFPSLHVERKLGKRLRANLSYSSRIGWPNLAAFDPRLRFSDPTTARAGNPLLRPEKTHSLEMKLMASGSRHEAELTGYVQRTRDLRSELIHLEDEVLVNRPVNLGTRTSIGGHLNLRGPIVSGLRYTVTAELSRDRISDGGDIPYDEEGIRSGASLQLDYRDGVEGRAGADQVRVTARYSGPSEAGLSRLSSTMRADLSWSHALTDRLASVLTAAHSLKSLVIHSIGQEVVSRASVRAGGPTVSLALTYGLSASNR